MNKAGWALALVAAGIGTGLYLSRKPWMEYQRQKAVTRKAQSEMRQAEHDRAEYVRQSAEAQSPVGRESIARERGYRKANEVPVEDLK